MFFHDYQSLQSDSSRQESDKLATINSKGTPLYVAQSYKYQTKLRPMLLPLLLYCAIASVVTPIAAWPSSQHDPQLGLRTGDDPRELDRRIHLTASSSFALSQSTNAPPVVNTSVGSFQGTRLTLADGSSQDIFYGIPYAQPPIGSLRFARPQPVNSTASTAHNNTTPAKECYQPLGSGGITLDDVSEDCLILDVYRPTPESNSSTNSSLLP